jgi:hypothetical protein
MKVRYIGPFDEVEVPYFDNGIPKSVTFKHGQTQDIPDDLAKGVEGEFGGLLEQTDNYEIAKAAAPKD